MQPDALIIQDPTLLHQVDLFKGVRAGSLILLNSMRSFAELGLSDLAADVRHFRFCRVPATELAQKHVGRPVPNAALLGGFAAVSGEVRLESVVAAIRAKFPGKIAEGNVAAATEAFGLARKSHEVAHA